jgi:three-Cys-motif partner protein
MNRFWGDDSWQDAAYNPDNNMFHLDIKEPGNRPILAAFLNRLQTVAGFNFVSTPLAMKNTHNSVIYYLCFASHNKTAGRIVDGIFNARRKRGV